LHPSLLEAGLVAAMRAHCEEFEAISGIEAQFTADLERAVPSDLQLCLYRITQEALRNVAKHSGAKQVGVSLSNVDDYISLTIEDTGRGFDWGTRGGSGIGLVSMKERVRMFGGTFTVESKIGGGTMMRVMIPLKHAYSAGNSSLFSMRPADA
jgi:signal transduction histidine kinase